MIRSSISEKERKSTALKTFKRQQTESKASARPNKCSFCSSDNTELMFGGGNFNF